MDGPAGGEELAVEGEGRGDGTGDGESARAIVMRHTYTFSAMKRVWERDKGAVYWEGACACSS